jgi:hypothetical protein
MTPFEDRCYVVYGTGFKPLKIKGIANKNALLVSLKEKGFKPKSSMLNSNSPAGKKCKVTATFY